MRSQRTMYIIPLNNIGRADCMLLLNNETRKIIFPFPVLWFWLRRPTIQFPGSLTWCFNYCVHVYFTSVTNLCDTIISLSQLVILCYIFARDQTSDGCNYRQAEQQTISISWNRLLSQAVVLFWVIFLFDFLIITRRRQ